MTSSNNVEKGKTKLGMISIVLSACLVAIAFGGVLIRTGELSSKVYSSQEDINRLCREKLDKEVFQQFCTERENRLKAIEGSLERIERKLDRKIGTISTNE